MKSDQAVDNCYIEKCCALPLNRGGREVRKHEHSNGAKESKKHGKPLSLVPFRGAIIGPAKLSPFLQVVGLIGSVCELRRRLCLPACLPQFSSVSVVPLLGSGTFQAKLPQLTQRRTASISLPLLQKFYPNFAHTSEEFAQLGSGRSFFRRRWEEKPGRLHSRAWMDMGV